MNNNIEVELRAEVSLNRFKGLLHDLNKEKKQVSHTKRLSVMFLGIINGSNFDIRTRISSNAKAELVVKKGDFHTHDRIEASQEINKEQFLGIVKILSLLNFQSKITERENFVFNLDNEITLVLVKAGSIAYVEIEKMSNRDTVESNKLQLIQIINELKLKLINDDKEFNELCDRLTKYSDWTFDETEAAWLKLKTTLESY